MHPRQGLFHQAASPASDSQAFYDQCECENTQWGSLKFFEVVGLRVNVPGLKVPTSSKSRNCLILPTRGLASCPGKSTLLLAALPLATTTPENLIHRQLERHSCRELSSVTSDLMVMGHLSAGRSAASAGWNSSTAVRGS